MSDDAIVGKTASKREALALRGDIQILRAFAVLIVIFYHLPINYLKNFTEFWWIGVDIFFVISGYLILGMLVRQQITYGRINLSSFLARRAFRLVPSTIFVVVLSSLILWATTQSKLFVALGFRDAAASLASLENFYLISKSENYLAADSLSSPFTHFWSLAVEEQFYFFASLTLFLAFKFRQSSQKRTLSFAIVLFAAVALLGLGASELLQNANSATAYFNPLTRIWEFAIGGLAATLGDFLKARSYRIAPKHFRLVAIVIYIAIGATILGGSSFGLELKYPGLEIAPILIALSAALLIYSLSDHPAPIVRRQQLPQRFLIYVGKRSYVLYLWHLPVIFLFANVLQQSGTTLILMSLVTSFALAAATGILIEDRFRDTKRTQGTVVALTSLLLVPLIVLFGLAFLATHQLKVQAKNAEEAVTSSLLGQVREDTFGEGDYSWAYYSIPEMYESGCHGKFGSEVIVCTFGSNSPQALRVALVGDSHATQFAPGLKMAAESTSAVLYTLLQSSCALDAGHVPGAIASNDLEEPYVEECRLFTSSALDALREIQPEIVLLANAAAGVSNMPGGNPENSLSTLSLFEELKRILPQSQVIVIEDPPLATAKPNLDLFFCADHILGEDCTSASNSQMVWDRLAAIAKRNGIPVVSVWPQICSETRCIRSINGVPIYRDSNHLTAALSISLAPFWKEFFEEWRPLSDD